MEVFYIEKMTINHYNKIKDVLETDFDDFWNKDILKDEIENENSYYIVALYENEIIGFAGIKYNFENVEIMNIVTRKNMRRNGVAELLLKNLICISKNYNVSKIELEVNENNEPAIKLYEKIGFKEAGRRKKYYNGIFDAILMDYIL